MSGDKSNEYCLVGLSLKCSQGWWICQHLGGSTSSGNDQGQQGQTVTPVASDTTTAFPVEANISGVTGENVTLRWNLNFTLLGCCLKHFFL
jgi:hypothetical protein